MLPNGLIAVDRMADPMETDPTTESVRWTQSWEPGLAAERRGPGNQALLELEMEEEPLVAKGPGMIGWLHPSTMMGARLMIWGLVAELTVGMMEGTPEVQMATVEAMMEVMEGATAPGMEEQSPEVQMATMETMEEGMEMGMAR